MGSYCFDVDAFAQDEFDMAAFLEDCRTRNPMETIHHDLKEFQTTLENQLVAIINEDYTEFLQLSSKLKGVDEAVSSVRSPLLAILKRVDQVHQVILQLQKKIHTQIQQEQELNKVEEELNLSIRISEKLLLIEQLLQIDSYDTEDEDGLDPEREQSGAEEDDDEDGFTNFEQITRQNKERDASEGCAQLERATQLLLQLDLEFLEGVDVPMVQRHEKRLAVAEDSLLRRLETEFATEIFPDTFYTRDHSMNATTLSYLLRSYVLLQKTSIPEGMMARLLVTPFAEEHLTRGKLDGRVRGSCQGLSQLYNEILEYISKTFQSILNLPICRGEASCSIDVLGNAIWKPIYEVLTSKHSIIFKTADADRFHLNYHTSMQFLEDMEQFCGGSEIMRRRFRTHPCVIEFKEKWNTDVYFELRYQQLSTALDQSFSEKRNEESTSEHQLLFGCTRVVWKSMEQCWGKDVFLEPLVAEFTRLCLQLLVQYCSLWKQPIQEAVVIVQNQCQTSSRISFTDIPLACLTSEADVVCAGNDFHLLHTKIVNELFPVMKQYVAPFVDDIDEWMINLFSETLEVLNQLETECWSAAAALVSEECKKVLPALRSIKGQYQMTNKPKPTTASTYVPSIIRPLEVFMSKWSMHFTPKERANGVFQKILDPVCELYYTLSSELLKSAQELEESLKSRKMQRQVPSSSSESDGLSDTDKMRCQLRLDVEEMHRLVKNLGYELSNCEAYKKARDALTIDTNIVSTT